MNSWISASRRLIPKDYVWNKKLNHDITECCTDNAMGRITENLEKTWRKVTYIVTDVPAAAGLRN